MFWERWGREQKVGKNDCRGVSVLLFRIRLFWRKVEQELPLCGSVCNKYLSGLGRNTVHHVNHLILIQDGHKVHQSSLVPPPSRPQLSELIHARERVVSGL